MIKAEIKKEIMMTNEEIAEHLWNGDDIIMAIEDCIKDVLFNEYNISYSDNDVIVNQLTDRDYAQILEFLAKKLREG